MQERSEKKKTVFCRLHVHRLYSRSSVFSRIPCGMEADFVSFRCLVSVCHECVENSENSDISDLDLASYYEENSDISDLDLASYY